ncbi:MAG: TIGR00730 family Rossman fold protein, partial [Bacteroidetes bacterium]|nr:TIGR00730 family Rossman fold protein [Bacteroidota bacterium]
YGGGCIGLMGHLADSTLLAGGRVVGVIPRSLLQREVAHMGLTELIVTETMHERKAAMADRAQAFIALPGGFGTFDELFEIITWAQLGIHSRPIGLLNTAGFFTPLLAWLEQSVVEQGFVKPKQAQELLKVEDSIESILNRLTVSRESHFPPSGQTVPDTR